jgi:hypothetical protein
MISTAMDNLCEASFVPFDQATLLRDAVNKDGSWGKALSARGLFLAQTLVSIVTIPLALIALLFAPALALVTEGKEGAFQVVKDLGETTLVHACLIPTCFISAFVPHSLEWRAPLYQVAEFVESSQN